MLRFLVVGALVGLARGAPLESSRYANALAILADSTVSAYVHDTQSAMKALTIAQAASQKTSDSYAFEVKAANATNVIATMHEILSILQSEANVSIVNEDHEPLKKPRDSADPHTTTIKFVQKQMEQARFNARQGLRKLKAWADNMPEPLFGKTELLTNITTLQKRAVADLFKIEDQLKKTLVERLKKVGKDEEEDDEEEKGSKKEAQVKKFKDVKKAKDEAEEKAKKAKDEAEEKAKKAAKDKEDADAKAKKDAEAPKAPKSAAAVKPAGSGAA